MNVFEKAIRDRKIASEEELKRLFWKLAKKLHPDAAGVEKSHERFIKLKEDFDDAVALLRTGKPFPGSPTPAARPPGKPDREACVQLFIDLLAGNFPVDKSIRNQKTYLARIDKLNAGLSLFGPEYRDLFYRFEEEMYGLKGKTVVSNQEYAVVKLYLYSFSDFTYLRFKYTEMYLKSGYDLVHGILKSKNMNASIRFLNWLVADIVGKSTNAHDKKN
ncbi:MAG: hypothetical protein WCT14_11675 [Treponemataceae bacterium]